ncbi:hypothetical protein ACLQ2Q_18160 [Microbacterium sp. DT81.1]|uniref:hypothetical protein n=1 Tax=Microbacterium sp. DT81.1 TaxID=3393413 RepID=UPI003CF4C4FE
MTTSPISPPVFKGALVAVDPLRPTSSVIIFQYNPETMTRTLQARTTGGEAGSGPLRLSGPPEETIKLTIEIDATDRLEAGDPIAETLGIAPALAALELLLYPSSVAVIANEVLARVGVVEILPMAAPLTLLVWGTRRIIPVRVTDFSITEESFDPSLNPIRAKVDLGLRTVSYYDTGMLSAAGALSLAAHIAREVLGTVNTAEGAAAAIRSAAGVGGPS